MRAAGAVSARLVALVLAVAFAAAVAAVVGASSAHGAFGEDFTLVPINGGAGTQAVPAVPDASHFWWAGTCDRAAAPDPPADLAALGGIGTLADTVQAPNQSAVPVDVAAPPTPLHCIDWRVNGNVPNHPSQFWRNGTPSWRLPAVVRAGAHADGSATFGVMGNTGDLDNVVVELPAGFVGNPGAVPKCSADQFAIRPQQCHPSTQVGVFTIWLQAAVSGNLGFSGQGDVVHVPVFNLEPREGNAAELGLIRLSGEGQVTARLIAKARTNGDFGVTTFTGQIPSALPVYGQAITIWGVPWAAHNDVWRAPQAFGRGNSGCHDQPDANGSRTLPETGLPDEPGCRIAYDPSWGAIQPFISLETDCNPAPSTQLGIDSYQFPGPRDADGDPIYAGHPDSANWKTYDSPALAVTDCASLGFDPDIDFQATGAAADGPSGLDVALDVPQNNVARESDGSVLELDDPDYHEKATAYFDSDAGRASAHLKDTVVTLPAGMSVNPSLATGLVGCTDSQFGLRELGSPPLFNNGDPFDKDGGADGAECPDGSKLGTARVDTPVLDEPLTGEVVLGQPKSTDPQSGEMLRLFLVLRNKERGLVAKIYGSSKADPATGQLVTTFANNPELPFDRLALSIQGGERGALALPQRCGNARWSATFTPWSSGPNVGDAGALAVSERCGFGFAPTQHAVMDTQRPRGHGTFSFDFSRPDGDQWLAGLTAKLPQGLLASVKDVPLCSDAQAGAGSCPAGSQVGTVNAAAGAGTPFVLEREGEVFLTDGYKGCAYGLAVKIRPIAGPFRGALELSPIVVRQALCVDPRSAQVSAVSDPLPLIHHGIPLRVRRVTVRIDRERFAVNPSGCAAKRVRGTYTGNGGATVDRVSDFQAKGCAALAFKPRLAMRLVGRKQTRTGGHPSVRALVRQRGLGEAGVRRAVVHLPKSLALDVNNAQALCEFEDGTKDDLENRCPRGSIVGRARAVSPLLNEPLSGPVFFVKNIRIDPQTGNEIRTLPMIVAALRGEVAVNLVGESSTTKAGKLVNTFAQVPDAPISRFNLNIKGGRDGILAVTRTQRSEIDLCRRPNAHVARTGWRAHNNKRRRYGVRMKTPCPKANKRRAAAKRKRAAQRRAARRNHD